MENSTKLQENQNPSFLPSPNGHSPNSSTSSSSSNSNGIHHQQPPQQQQQPPPPPPPAPSPKPITRSESNPYPTTFVQADTSSFKQVVQMLTGSSETAKQASTHKPASDSVPTKNSIPPRRQQGFKLYERRNSVKNFKISPLVPGFNPTTSGFSPRKPEILSPSILDFPSLVLSPVTPLMIDPFNRSPHHHHHHHQHQHQQNNGSGSGGNRNGNLDSGAAAEEKAIAEKGFYFHPSPSTTPRDPEPRLLPLFPVTSPRVSGSSSS